MLINKIYLLSTMFAFLPMWSYAQKITLGACTTKDGGAYKGDAGWQATWQGNSCL